MDLRNTIKAKKTLSMQQLRSYGSDPEEVGDSNPETECRHTKEEDG